MKLKITTAATVITALIGMTNLACAHKAEPPTFQTTGYKKTGYTKKKTKKKTTRKDPKSFPGDMFRKKQKDPKSFPGDMFRGK